MSVFSETVPPAAACDRSGARAGEKGLRKVFRPRVADNSLISRDSRSKMEGRVPRRAHDASLKLRGARPEANAALRRVAGFGNTGAGRPFLIWIARNPLKSPESDEGIQENPSPFPWSGLDLLWFGLEEFGPRRCGVGRSLPARLSMRVNEARRRGRSEIGPGSYSRREMAPQRIEKVEFAPGNGMAPRRWTPQYLVEGDRSEEFPSRRAAATSPSPRAASRPR